MFQLKIETFSPQNWKSDQIVTPQIIIIYNVAQNQCCFYFTSHNDSDLMFCHQYEKQKHTWRHKPSLSIWTTLGCSPAFWGRHTCTQLFTLEFVSVVMTTLNLMLFTGDSILTLVAARPGSHGQSEESWTDILTEY